MHSLSDFTHIYFIGIGGIGMSALARWFIRQGYQVAGYDKTESFLTQELTKEGILIHYQDDQALIPRPFKDPQQTLVVYTPAIPSDHLEFTYFLGHNFYVYKRAEVLGLISKKYFTIAIAGTHGKTTTTSMVTHLLQVGRLPVTAFIGGITQNYKSNLLLNLSEQALMVLEADEYDRSFLQLHPDIAIITSMDADHLDIYKEAGAVKAAFHAFAAQLKPNGKLLLKEGLFIPTPPKGEAQYFGIDQASFKAQNIQWEQNNFYFDLITPAYRLENIRMQVPGMHNIFNALAASAVAYCLDIPSASIREGLESFMGVKRRFEYILKEKNCIQIDDYAHHPEEIKATLSAIKSLYPDKLVTVIFQPHLFSRTRDFAEGFAQSLSMADYLILLPIYPAREAPIAGVSSQMLLEKSSASHKYLTTKEELLEMLKTLPTELVITLGAGDIDQLVSPVKEVLLQKIT